MLRDAFKLIAVELLALAAFAGFAFGALAIFQVPRPDRALLDLTAPALGLPVLAYGGAILVRRLRR